MILIYIECQFTYLIKMVQITAEVVPYKQDEVRCEIFNEQLTEVKVRPFYEDEEQAART